MKVDTFFSSLLTTACAGAAAASLLLACGGGGMTTPETPATPDTTAPEAPAMGETPSAAGPATIPHELEGKENCTSCHQVGGAGAGMAGGMGMPEDHKDRDNSACTGCHKPAS